MCALRRSQIVNINQTLRGYIILPFHQIIEGPGTSFQSSQWGKNGLEMFAISHTNT